MQQTFDIFDTLIARKCVSPQAIFSLVEQRSGVANFAARRIEAEQQLAGQSYSLDDIYARLAQLYPLETYRVELLKQLELDTELANVIPIRRNLRKVRDGDLLITDMYLDAAFIEKLLRRAGLRKHVAIYQSTAGKGTGEVWRKLRGQELDLLHTGDNPHSDEKMPGGQSFGTVLTQCAPLSPTEQFLADRGLTGTALTSRILRLAIDQDDPVASGLLHAQAAYNVPLLILASLYLHRHLESHAVASVLFSSRDCNGWRKIFDLLGDSGVASGRTRPKTHYFFSSRLARSSRSGNYLDYARALAPTRTLIVDLCGTGLSLAKLVADSGIDAGSFFLLKIVTPAIVEHARQWYAGDVEIHADSILNSDEQTDNPSWETWEMLNYASHGMALDVRRLDDVFFPVCADIEFSGQQLGWIEQMESSVEAALEWLQDPLIMAQLLRADAHVATETLVQSIAALWQEGARSVFPGIAFGATHRLDNRAISARLLASRPDPASSS